jgi:23S rRNA pseudouridine1911/1915/1917 synthase
MVHRLDRPVSGVVLLARTSKAAGRLSAQFRAGTVEKVYRAVVEGNALGDDEGEWSDTLWKDERRNVVSVVPPGTPGGVEARLAFRVLERRARTIAMELRPITGRSHQLRVQLASRGLPILGDRKYEATSLLRALDGKSRVALHASRVTFTHPTRPEAISVSAPFPADWPS